MNRIENLLKSVRRLLLPANREPTDNQKRAIEQLGLGRLPVGATFAEVSAILTARTAAREVLNALTGSRRSGRKWRQNVEPCLIEFIANDARLMRELIERNKERWGFCDDSVPPPTATTRADIFAEARRLIAAVPSSAINVISLNPGNTSKKAASAWVAGRSRSRRPYRRTYISWRRKAQVIVLLVAAPVFLVSALGEWIANPQVTPSSDLAGRASVIDGDTIEIHGKRIRFWGIDAPEASQRCFKDGRPWRCGSQSANALADFLAARTVACEKKDTDRYGRAIAVCTVGVEDVGSWLVKNGWALDYTHYSKGAHSAEQQQARAARLGVWQGEFKAPWDWRRQGR